MMYIHMFMLTFFLLTSSPNLTAREDRQQLQLMGEFIPLAGLISRPDYVTSYYFLLKKDGKKFLFPVEAKMGRVKRIIRENLGATFWIEAEIRNESLWLEHKGQSIVILELNKVTPLKLSNFGFSFVGSPFESMVPQQEKDELVHLFPEDQVKVKRGGQWIFSDHLVEGLLFVAGPALLATMLLPKSTKSICIFPPITFEAE